MSPLSRRLVVAAAAAAGTAACTPYTVQQPTLPAPRRRPRGIDPDVALAASVLVDEREIIDLIDATLEEHPRLREPLEEAREVHLAHVALLNDAVPDGVTASVSPTPSPAGSASPDGVPRSRRRALTALAQAEEELSLLDKRSAFAAQSGSFARVLASMAAAAAQQAALIGELRTGQRRRR